jgi:hypothetical protein
MNEPRVPYDIIEIYARDWSTDEGPVDVDYHFKPYYAHIIGYCLREDADSIVLCAELFDDKARKVQTIPKETIKVRRVLRAKEVDDENHRH